ncbi:unnamed protein product [Ascophyllum nodosum]
MSTGESSDGLTEELVAGTPQSEYGSGGHRHPREMQPDTFVEKYGYSWDLCMVFPTEAPPDQPRAAAIVRRLHNAGLETYSFKSVQENEIIVKIRAPLERLARYAEDTRYEMLLDETKVERAMEEGSDDPPVEGSVITHDPKVTKFRPHEYIYGRYRTTQRLAPMYACPSHLKHPFSSVHRIKLICSIIESMKADGCGLDIVELKRDNALKAFFPYHDEERRQELQDLWIKGCSYPTAQPLEKIKDYLGEKIAMYFALIGHYTVWLGPLAIVGVITAIDQLAEWDLNATMVPYFSVFVSFWAVLMLEFWKWKESRLAMRWGMSHFERREQTRAEFKGDRIASYIDGKPMLYYPQEKYVLLMTLANTLVVGMLALTIALIALIFLLDLEWLNSSSSFFSYYGSYLTSILLSGEIWILETVYRRVAVRTTEAENHRTDTVFEDVLIAKLAVFQFVNAYASLYYIAFVQPFITGCTYSSCLNSLCQSLAIIFCTRLLISNTLEVYLPRFYMLWKMKKEKVGVPEDAPFSESETQYVFETYHEMMGPLEDMSEVLIQFGYVTLFVVSFSIAPLLACISNYIEIRTDAVKIMHEYRRPFPRGTQDIGTWQIVWTIVAAIAVATNAGLVFFTAGELDWSGENIVWGFLIWQYAILIPMGLFSLFVPDVPSDVTIQLARQRFITSKVIDQDPDDRKPRSRLSESGPLELHDADDQPPRGEYTMPKFLSC